MAWRGAPIENRAGNQALGYDRMGRHTGKLGGETSMATSTLAQGLGTVGPPGSTGWEPTIMYLFVLIIAEMFVFGVVSRLLK